ncbi:hypothetical protein AB0O76_40650 [Streptomyces sp. NPDC086554]|uniref:hypothetical protein n=1 Tax=Streptomyces sp. NPDC086554 TaxID=3154864 RepID=UPI003412685F
MVKARVVLNEAALHKAMSTHVTAKLLSQKASEIAATARNDAPKNSKGSWNMYARSLSVAAFEVDGVVHAAVLADRHPLLIEFGWRDKGGRRHAGRHVLKNALLKARQS